MMFLRTARNLAAAAPLLFPVATTFAKDPVSTSPHHQVVGPAHRAKAKRYRPRDDLPYSRVGTASWYGARFHRRRTASGEAFDQNALTAAHPTLPLPTIARVTNLENGRSIVVRINDRGPFAGNRLIDLSLGGARALGFERKGVARVHVSVLNSGAVASGVANDAGASTTSWPRRKRIALYPGR